MLVLVLVIVLRVVAPEVAPLVVAPVVAPLVLPLLVPEADEAPLPLAEEAEEAEVVDPAPLAPEPVLEAPVAEAESELPEEVGQEARADETTALASSLGQA